MMRRSIQMLTVCLSGLLLSGVTSVLAADPVVVGAAGSGVVPTLAGSRVFEDSGYARISRGDWTSPTNPTLSRSPLVYSRMYPSKFYGEHGRGASGPVRRYPIIAVPSDTTQLGYYYRRVPTWQYRADMLPPIPRPSRWHNRPSASQRTHGTVREIPRAPAARAQRVRSTLR
jgi:hypothetical protein